MAVVEATTTSNGASYTSGRLAGSTLYAMSVDVVRATRFTMGVELRRLHTPMSGFIASSVGLTLPGDPLVW
jgi:hypothetical protein